MSYDPVRIALKSLRDEELAQAFYEYLANRVTDEVLSNRLKELASMEASHVSFWRDFLNRRSVETEVHGFRKLLSLTFLKLTYRIFGLGFIIKLLEHDELGTIEEYLGMLESSELSDHEKELLSSIVRDEVHHETLLEKEEEAHKTFLEHVREIILGMNDGYPKWVELSDMDPDEEGS